MSRIEVRHESRLVKGSVLDCAAAPLLAALRRYDSQLYFEWNSKKRGGLGCWQLKRKHELKSVKEGRYVDAPTKGRVYVPGDIFPNVEFTIVAPKQRSDFVKDFNYLTYDMVSWVASQDLWKYGYKGKDFVSEADYRNAKWMEAEEQAAHSERQYMIRQHKTQFRDLAEYIYSGGNPHRLADYWNDV